MTGRNSSSRTKKLAKNTVASLCFQISSIVCGFILPRAILSSFGSDVNGLVNSITQFLQIVAFLDLGVGAVIQSSLYRPLAEKDTVGIGRIVCSAEKIFTHIAQILAVYIVILLVLYPFFVDASFSRIYTMTLIAAMSISSFAQYYFGVVDRLLLTADQRGYIQYNAQTATLLLNTFVCVVLIKCGASIQLVKLTTSIIYIARPFYLRMYVRRHYAFNRKESYDTEPISQKWNGIAQHVAAIILDCTDNIVLTIFSSLANVSIYSVYHLVVYGVKQLFLSLMSGVQSLMGEMWAKNEVNNLTFFFGWVEWIVHTGVTFVFSCTGLLILDFVSVYTRGIYDANYYQPVFAVLITLANAGHCLRLPYNTMILAAGHYKQTQSNYIIAALMNIVISIVTVRIWGLIGVAIGTLCAMVYQTFWMAIYNSNNFIYWPIRKFLKQVFVDAVTVFSVTVLSLTIRMEVSSYLTWVFSAIKTVLIVGIGALIVNYIFYRDKIEYVIKKIKKQWI